MHITIFQGASLDDAVPLGAMYFEARPNEGDRLEIDRVFYTVQKTWHSPNTHFAAEKFAILVAKSLTEGRNAPEPANETATLPGEKVH